MRSDSNRFPLAVMGAVFAVLGVLLSYFGYFWGLASPNPNELVGSILFWTAILVVLLSLPLRQASASFVRDVRTAAGAAVFTAYLAVHLLLYGFLLEGILAVVYGPTALQASPGVLVTTDTFRPASLLNAAFDLAYNPSISISLQPFFSAALSLYGISVALVIAILVVASVGETRRLGEVCTRMNRARSLVVLPALGVVLGASCCLSVAGIVSLAVPSASALTSVAWVYYFTYFVFPAVAIGLLYVNLRSIKSIALKLSR